MFSDRALLFAAGALEKAAFNGIRVLIVLYAAKVLALKDTQSFFIYGTFVSLSFITPFVGGILADRVFGHKVTLLSGAFLCGLGTLCFLRPTTDAFIWGLSFLSLGGGLFRSNVAQLIAQLAEDGNTETLFTKFYVVSNVGIVLGTLFCPIVGEVFSWEAGFFNASLFYLGAFALVWGVKGAALYDRIYSFLSVKSVLSFLFVALLLVVCKVIFQHQDLYSFFFGALILSIFRLLYIGYQENRLPQVGVLLFLMVVQTLFNIAYEQSISTLSLFAERNVERTVDFMLGGLLPRDLMSMTWTIPVMAFLLIDPIFSVLFGVPFTKVLKKLSLRGLNFKSYEKFSGGIFALGLGFAILACSRFFEVDGLVKPHWILSGNVFFVLGQLLIFPVGLSLVHSLNLKKYAAELMGIWFLSMGSSQILSAFMADITSAAQDSATLLCSLKIYCDAFLQYGLFCVLAAYVTWLLGRMIERRGGGRFF